MTTTPLTAPIMRIGRHRLSTDGRGITTLVGLHGCPLSCHYCLNDRCHTPEGVWRYMTAQELYNEVVIDNIYFLSTGGGITFGGGEPALHSSFIKEFAQLNTHKWNITLESSLNVPTHHIEQLARVVDDYIIDIKSLNPATYRRYTGMDIDLAMHNLQYLIGIDKAPHITVRTPIIPGYNDVAEVEATTQQLREMGIEHFDAFTYHSDVARRPQPDGKSGKSTCNVLKRIRAIIAEANHIAYTPTPCTHTTCTTGNCPVCERELAQLTQQITATENPIL